MASILSPVRSSGAKCSGSTLTAGSLEYTLRIIVRFFGLQELLRSKIQSAVLDSYKTKTTTVGGVASIPGVASSDAMHAASQGGSSPVPAVVSKWKLVENEW